MKKKCKLVEIMERWGKKKNTEREREREHRGRTYYYIMSMMNTAYDLGEKRLILVHSRVDYLCNKLCYGLNDNGYHALCKVCADDYDDALTVGSEQRKTAFLKCSGYEWVCKARREACAIQSIPWNEGKLMKQKHYTRLLSAAVKNMEPRVALYSINEFHRRLMNEQLHMVKMCHIGEQATFPTYEPYKLRNEIFPLPPPGLEFDAVYHPPMDFNRILTTSPYFRERVPDEGNQHYVYSWNKDCPCPDAPMILATESCSKCKKEYKKIAELVKSTEIDAKRREISENIDADLAPLQPNWETFLMTLQVEKGQVIQETKNETQRELNLIRAKSILNCPCGDFLANLDVLAGMPDPCEWCDYEKHHWPRSTVTCTGLEELCMWKYHFFREWPVGLDREVLLTRNLLNCTTRFDYQDLMNKVFSMKYIERCVQVKGLIDVELAVLQPRLTRIMAYYDALIFRYYWPRALAVETYESDYDGMDDEEEEEDGLESSSEDSDDIIEI